MNSKIIASVVGIVAVIGGGGYYYMNMNQAQANPDYICTATIVNPVCNYDVNSCEWSGGLGTCSGTQQVSLTYSSHRVSCAGTDSYYGNDQTNNTIYQSISSSVWWNVSQTHVDDAWGGVTSQDGLTYSTKSCVVTGVPAPATTNSTSTTAWTGSSNGYVESETASGDTNTGSAQ